MLWRLLLIKRRKMCMPTSLSRRLPSNMTDNSVQLRSITKKFQPTTYEDANSGINHTNQSLFHSHTAAVAMVCCKCCQGYATLCRVFTYGWLIVPVVLSCFAAGSCEFVTVRLRLCFSFLLLFRLGHSTHLTLSRIFLRMLRRGAT